MGRYQDEQWYKDHVAKMVQKYGDVPPPWIYMENSHPMSIGWRMGGGETHIMVFGEWWKGEAKTFEQRIDYFKKWPAPPRWCGWMADLIWDLEPWESEEEFDYGSYFAKLKELGFEGTDRYEEDMMREDYI